MSKCISNRGEYSEHTFTHNPECDYCGEPLPKRSETMRTALEQIQELHKPVDPVFSWKKGLTLYPPCPDCNGKAGVHECGCWADKDTEYECSYCNDFGNPRRTSVLWPCATRKLADAALTDRMARTNQGENNGR